MTIEKDVKKKKSKTNAGKIFEQQVIKSCPSDTFVMRIKDTTMRFKGDNNICDMLFYRHPTLILLELKSTKEASLSFNNIKDHQIEGLYKASRIENLKAGLLIEMRKYEETYFLSIEKAVEYMALTKRKSFSIDYLRENAIRVNQVKKRTRFTFDIEGLLEKLI